MEITILLVQQILQLAIMILVGFLIVKCGILKVSDSRVLSALALYVVTPCVIINAFQIKMEADIVQGLVFAFAASLILQAVLLALSYLLAKLFHMDEIELASVYYSNAGNLIVPLVTYIFGSEWVVYSCAYICVQTLIIWTHGKSLIARDKGFDLKKILLNVNVISVAIGLFLFLTQISLPSIVTGTMSSFAGMIGPICMLVTGMLMADMSWGEIFQNARIYLISIIRLLLIPVVVLLIIAIVKPQQVFGIQQEIILIVFLAVTTPAASTVTQMAQVYHNRPKYAGAICVMTTLMAMVTMPLMVLLLQTVL